MGCIDLFLLFGNLLAQNPGEYLVVNSNERVVRWEGAGGTLSMNQQSLLLAIHHVLLHLGNVVGHIIDHMHVKIVWCGREHF